MSIISALATWRRPTEPRPGCGGWTLETPADGEPAPGTLAATGQSAHPTPTQPILFPMMVTIPHYTFTIYIYTILLPSYVINMIHNMPFSSQT